MPRQRWRMTATLTTRTCLNALYCTSSNTLVDDTLLSDNDVFLVKTRGSIDEGDDDALGAAMDTSNR